MNTLNKRVEALDLARFIALIGIVINHTLQKSSFSPLVTALQDYHAVLFVILLGFLIPGRPQPLKKVLVKGLGLIVLGFALGSADLSIDVILVNLGLLYLLGNLLNKYVHRIRYLASIALVWVLATPIISHILRQQFEQYVTPVPMNFGLLMAQYNPVQLFVHPFLYSHYPVLQWLFFVLVGMILAKILRGKAEKHRHCAVQDDNLKNWKIAVIGAGLFIISKATSFLLGGDLWKMDNGNTNTNNWEDIIDSGAYTGTTLGMLSSTGIALIVITLCLYITGYGKFKDVSHWQDKIHVSPYIAGATLSLYSIHVFTFTFVTDTMLKNDLIAVSLLGGTLLMFALLAMLWKKIAQLRQYRKPGPVEEFLSYLAR